MPLTDTNISKIIKLLERTRANLKVDSDMKIKRIDGAIELLKQNTLNKDLLTILNIATTLNSTNQSEQSIVDTLGLFEEGNANPNPTPKLKGPVTKRIIKLLETKQQFLHNKQIAEILEEDFPELDEAQLSQKLSSALSNLKRQEKIIMFIDGRSSKKTYWGKKQWLENGKIKNGFEFREIDL
ncbi:MAG: hypothetical protein HKN75_08400 [Bacteroidia bacterium]|nr:hypothetical protein [Bacteroidia bacterium]